MRRMKFTDYEVLEGTSPRNLGQRVRQYIGKGWTPSGRSYIDHDNIFYQTMVKYEFEREDQATKTESSQGYCSEC